MKNEKMKSLLKNSCESPRFSGAPTLPASNFQLQSSVFSLQPFLFLLPFLALAGCSPTVQINTPEPLKVDISMKIDVYDKGKSEVAVAQRRLGEEEMTVMRQRDLRSGEIWSMKNDGAAAENERGYLEARPKTGWKVDYVNGLVAEENRDRRILYEAEAKNGGIPLASVEAMAGKRLRQQAQTHGK